MAIALAASSAFAVACVDDEAATTVDSPDAATDAVAADVVADGAAIPDVVADTLDEGLPPGCTCEGYSLGTDQHGIDCFAQLFGFEPAPGRVPHSPTRPDPPRPLCPGRRCGLPVRATWCAPAPVAFVGHHPSLSLNATID